MRKYIIFFGISAATLFTSAQTVRYVTVTGAGTETGSSWATASSDLQLMIDQSAPGDSVFVAAGTYIPVYSIYPPLNREGDKSFILAPDVKIFGGFPNNGNPSFTDRDWKANETVLSGNLGVINNQSYNSYHVVISVGAVGTACLDGFTIRDGRHASGDNNSPALINGLYIIPSCGGGIAIYASSPLLSNLSIRNNTSNDGGGVYMTNSSAPVLQNLVIRNNTSSSLPEGVTIINNSNPLIVNTLIHNNSRGVKCINSSPTIINTTIIGNGTYGMYNDNSSPKVYNSIIYGNITAVGVPIIDVQNVNSTPEYKHSLVSGVTTDDFDGNVDGIDPYFNGDYTLHFYSICIDKGDASLLPSGYTTDLAGNLRVQNQNIDIGCYESPYQRPNLGNIIYVNSNVSVSGDGSSWANAATDLAGALLEARRTKTVKEIWVAEGTYEPGYANLTSKTFLLPNGIALYGGFPANADDINNAPMSPSSPSTLTIEQARNTRNWQTNPVILDGKNTAYHIFIAANSKDTVLIDGFTIIGGNANGTNFNNIDGYKVYQGSGAGITAYASNIKLKNTTIQKNTAITDGGGIWCHSSSLVLENVTIDSNIAGQNAQYTGNGSGLYASQSFIELNNVDISNNTALRQGSCGGGLYLSSSVLNGTKTNIFNNTASQGGGIYTFRSSAFNLSVYNNTATSNGGGIYNNVSQNDTTVPTLENIAVINNFSNYGSGIHNNFVSSIGDTTKFVNLTVCNNKFLDGTQGEGIRIDDQYLNNRIKICNSVIADNTVLTTINSHTDYYHSYYYTSGLNTGAPHYNIVYTSKPSFADPANNNYRIGYNSDLKNQGDNSFLSPHNQYDLDGNPRILEGTVDLGAYEAKMSPDTSGILYVNKNVIGGTETGDSWKNASKDLSWALRAARGDSDIKQIWVAKGVYKPSEPAASSTLYGAPITDRHNAFVLVEGVDIYGGFDGIEDNINQRKFDTLTVLSGDIGVVGNNSDNCYHVVIYSDWARQITKFNGFLVEGGNANGNGSEDINVNGGLVTSKDGGGIYNRVLNCVPPFGDGMSLEIDHVVVRSNVARFGGGIYNTGSEGADLYGYIYPLIRTNNLMIYNTLIYDNTAYRGGGVYNDIYVTYIMDHTTIANNKLSGSNAGGGIYHNTPAGGVFISSTIVQFNDGENFSYADPWDKTTSWIIDCLIKDETFEYNMTTPYTRIDNLDGNKDPLFVDAVNGDYRLRVISPCINRDKSFNLFDPEDYTDLGGNPRIYQYFSDMGAYEYTLYPDTNGRIYVNKNTTALNGKGGSWNDAVSELAFPMLSAFYDTTINEIWVAQGTYYPCMYNLVSTDLINGYTIVAFNSFLLPHGVKTYGGFAGNETSINGRNWQNYPTILSGGTPQGGGYPDIHVVLSANNTNETHLDGFSISGGEVYDPSVTYSYLLYGHESEFMLLTPDINNACGGGVYNLNSEAVYKNLKIRANKTAEKGGGMYNLNSSPTLSDITFEWNEAASGGGMHNENASFILTNATIQNNLAHINGGGICNENANIVLTNTNIIGNTAQGDGGGVFNIESLPTFNGGNINGNTAHNGGGMFNVWSSPIINNVNMSGNFAQQHGGGIYNNWNSNPTLSGVIIQSNTAQQDGAGMYNNNSSPWLEGVSINGNVANTDGGGMYNNEMSFPVLSDGTITNNFAGNFGGGIYNFESSPDFHSVNIHNNRAANDGGGMYNETNSSPTFENTDFFHNTANRSGGGLFIVRSSFELTGITVRNNTAEMHGGGIYLCDLTNMDIFNVAVTQNNAANFGGGIFQGGASFDHTRLINVLLANNAAFEGGATYILSRGCEMINVTATKNTNNQSDMQSVTNKGNLEIHNSILYGNNCPTSFLPPNTFIDYSLVENVTIGGVDNNLDGLADNPYFIDPANDIFQLHVTYSPCINAGNDFYFNNLSKPATDLAEHSRFQNGCIDMGAYEQNLTNPYTKSINNNQEQEEIVSQTTNNWNLKTYPNPTESGQQITISLTNGNSVYENPVSLKLFSIEGSLLYNKMYLTGKFSMEVPQIAPGIYILQLQTETKETYMGKLVVK